MMTDQTTGDRDDANRDEPDPVEDVELELDNGDDVAEADGAGRRADPEPADELGSADVVDEPESASSGSGPDDADETEDTEDDGEASREPEA